jgi:hypothetical protein
VTRTGRQDIDHRALKLAVLLALGIACACASTAPAPAKPTQRSRPEAFDPSPWLASKSDLLVKVDMSELDHSSYWLWFSRWGNAVLQALAWRAGILADPRVPEVLHHATEVYLAVEFADAPDQAPDITVVARVREPVLAGNEEALLGGGRASYIAKNVVLLSSRSKPWSPGFAWPLPFTRGPALQFTADAVAVRKQVGGDRSNWLALDRAARLKGELRTAYGLAAVVEFEHAQGTQAALMQQLLDGWLARLRDDPTIRLMGAFEAAMRARVEPGERSSALVLTVESPESEVVCGAIDKGIAELAKAAAYGSVEGYLASNAKAGERQWDEWSCRALEWMVSVMSRYEQVSEASRYDYYRGSYVRESTADLRMKARQARYLLDTKCSFHRE